MERDEPTHGEQINLGADSKGQTENVENVNTMNEENPVAEGTDQTGNRPRKNFFKQKIALFFGYNGKAYKGLQKQK